MGLRRSVGIRVRYLLRDAALELRRGIIGGLEREAFPARLNNDFAHFVSVRHDFFLNRVTESWNRLKNTEVSVPSLGSFKAGWIKFLETAAKYHVVSVGTLAYRSIYYITITITRTKKNLKFSNSINNSADFKYHIGF